MITIKSPRPENWNQLTPEQRRNQKLKWQAEGYKSIKFVSAEAEKNYKTKLRRTIEALRVREPDRVPVSVSGGIVPLLENGMTYYDAIYDTPKAMAAFEKFNEKHAKDLETCVAPMLFPARVIDAMDLKLYAWPGHGVPESAPSYQFNEGEYMKPGEYDAFIRDPSDFWLRTYLPRIMGTFAPLEKVIPLTDIIEFPAGSLMGLARPEIQAMLQKLIDVGKELDRYGKATGEYSRKTLAMGYPGALPRCIAHAPFDTIGDTLRGTSAIIKDMFRQPDKLLEALDAAADMTIDSVLNSASAARAVFAWFPLHKGADGWMSEKQFEKFYFPSLKKVLDAFINDGLIVTLFAEGSYDTRLEYFTDFPKGSIHWLFDRSDMARAKKLFGGKFCIEGNVPSSLLATGKPADVKAMCKGLIETCGKGGGYILSAGASIANPKVENLKAMVDAAKEYGVYSGRKAPDDSDIFAGY
ncbi:MAG TPA: uroporphyrinogen decarboxylase family protein [Dehalococcoidales bacterium]|nr:uroporphyrinogen decarboxylase family protein [Dehalococcoidales bacterium]